MASLFSYHYAALYHYAAFARLLGDRRDPCQTARGGVISSLQSIEGFSEQRGKDDPSHSRQGCEDRHVILLPLSPVSYTHLDVYKRQVLDVLRKPPVQVAAGTTEAASAHITTLTARIRLINQQLREAHRQLNALTARLIPSEETGLRQRKQNDVADVYKRQ